MKLAYLAKKQGVLYNSLVGWGFLEEEGGEMIYNWINVIIGILTIIVPILAGVRGFSAWLHIIVGAVIAICAYMANQKAKE